MNDGTDSSLKSIRLPFVTALSHVLHSVVFVLRHVHSMPHIFQFPFLNQHSVTNVASNTTEDGYFLEQTMIRPKIIAAILERTYRRVDLIYNQLLAVQMEPKIDIKFDYC